MRQIVRGFIIGLTLGLLCLALTVVSAMTIGGGGSFSLMGFPIGSGPPSSNDLLAFTGTQWSQTDSPSLTNVTASGTLGVTGASTLAGVSATSLSDTGTLNVANGATVAGIIDASAIGPAVTSLPPTSGNALGPGWKLCLFCGGVGSDTDSFGIENFTLAVDAQQWLSMFSNSTLPANDATLSAPDSHAVLTLGIDGSIRAATLNITGASTLAGVSATNVTASGTLGVTGASTLAGVSATNVTASGTLGVTGASTLAGVSATNVTASGTLGVTGTLNVANGATVAGIIDASALGPSILSVPPASSNALGTGWKLCLFCGGVGSDTDSFGIENFTLAVDTQQWLSMFSNSTLPANDATLSAPDSHAVITLGIDGSIRAGTLGVTGASTLAGVSATNVTASGTLGVTGASTLTGAVNLGTSLKWPDAIVESKSPAGLLHLVYRGPSDPGVGYSSDGVILDQAITVTSCHESFIGWTGCSTFPKFEIADQTAGVAIANGLSISATATSNRAMTLVTSAVPKSDDIVFDTITAGVGCTQSAPLGAYTISCSYQMQ